MPLENQDMHFNIYLLITKEDWLPQSTQHHIHVFSIKGYTPHTGETFPSFFRG